MNRGKAEHWLEFATTGLTLLIVLCGVLFTGMTRTQDFLIAMGLCVILSILWIARIWISRTFKLLWPPVCWAGLAFLIYAVARTQQADVEYIARLEFLRLLVCALVFFSAMQAFRSRTSVRTLVFALAVLAVLSSIYAGYQSAIDPDHVLGLTRPQGNTYGRRGSGFFISPNSFALMLALIIPLIVSFATMSRLPALTRLILGYSIVPLIAGLGLTLSRSGWIATAAASLVLGAVLIRMRGRRATVAVILVVMLASGGALLSRSDTIKVRLARTFNYGVSKNDRYEYWNTAWDMWLSRPWTGVGPGHFDVRYRQFRSIGVQARPEHAHNDYLDLLADWGAIGGIIALAAAALLLSGVQQTWRALRENTREGSGRSDRVALTLGLGCAAVAWAFHSIFDFPVHVPGLAIMGSALAGILAGQLRQATPRCRFEPGPTGRLALTVLIAAPTAYLAWQGVILGSQHLALSRASRPDATFEEKVAGLEKAARIVPSNPAAPYALAELHRTKSWENPPDWREKAETAIRWFEISARLAPYNPTIQAQWGRTLDWLERPDEADRHYQAAFELDPHGYATAALVGWSLAERGDYPAARLWLEFSVFLAPGQENYATRDLLKIVEEALADTEL